VNQAGHGSARSLDSARAIAFIPLFGAIAQRESPDWLARAGKAFRDGEETTKKQEGHDMAGKAQRTTHRSTAGKKLYAVRDAKGRFKDIQTYERAHRADLKRKSKAEKKS